MRQSVKEGKDVHFLISNRSRRVSPERRSRTRLNQGQRNVQLTNDCREMAQEVSENINSIISMRRHKDKGFCPLRCCLSAAVDVCKVMEEFAYGPAVVVVTVAPCITAR